MRIGCGTAGERGDGRGEPVDADYVCLGRTCDVRVGSVCVWGVCVRVGDAGTAGVEVVYERGRAARMGGRGHTHNLTNNTVPHVSSSSDRSTDLMTVG